MKESLIQANIVKFLSDNFIFSHSIPNEAYGRSNVAQMQLVTMGLRSGTADLIDWIPLPGEDWEKLYNDMKEGIVTGEKRAIMIYVEVKTATGKQSPAQKRFEKRCRVAGIYYKVVRSVEEVRRMIEL